jgi:hypothetical protein
MRWFALLFSTRFWIAVWILVLFIGLLPLPPAAQLVILVGFLSHSGWYVRNRFRRAAQRRAFAMAEKAQDEEHRRLRRRRSLFGDSPHGLAYAEIAAPKHHGVFVGLSIDQEDGPNHATREATTPGR